MNHPDLIELDKQIDTLVAKYPALAYRLKTFQDIVKSAAIIQGSQEFQYKRVRYYMPFVLDHSDEEPEFFEGYKEIIRRHVPDMTYFANQLFINDCKSSGIKFTGFGRDEAIAIDNKVIELIDEVIDGKYNKYITDAKAANVRTGDSGVVMVLEYFLPIGVKNPVIVPVYSVVTVTANNKGEFEIAANAIDGKDANPYLVDMERVI